MNNFEELRQELWCVNYFSYLDLRQKGLKKKAKEKLVDFLLDFKSQDKLVRRDFVNTINQMGYFNNNYHRYLPQNLADYFDNELTEWIKEEPNNPIPYRWTRNLDLMKIGIRLDPHDQIALAMYGSMLINGISMNQHEIPSGYRYDGSLLRDIELIEFYSSFVENINDPDLRKKYMENLTELKNCALDHINSK